MHTGPAGSLPGAALIVFFALGDPITNVCAQDTLDTIRQRGTLIWGADQEGGGPFVYPRENDPTQIQGFEVELAEYLARKLGVRAEFAQGQWDKLPDLMDLGNIDIVLNGYEWSAARAERYGTSIPYYVYELQLLARKDDASLNSWIDVAPSEGRLKRIAVLGGSAAQDYLQQNFGDRVEIVSYEGATDAMRAVELTLDGLDANLQDLCVVAHYGDGFPALKRVGEPVGRGYYVVLTRQDDQRLLAAINAAIIDGLRDGTLRKIYEKYGMWNPTQCARGLETGADGDFTGDILPDKSGAPPPKGSASVRGWRVVQSHGPLLLDAAKMTVLLSVASMPLAILIGLISALLRLYGPWLLAAPARLYVEVVRGTPLALQLYFIFFLIPELLDWAFPTADLSISPVWAAIIGLAVNYSAYEAEIYRAGLQAIPRGQMEAALALGMTRGLALRRIIIPQATRLVIPPVTNDFIALFKDTAVCSVITVVELSKEYSIQARSTQAIVELGLVTAVLYLSMSYPLSLLAGALERKMARKP
jgi:polar amino acid transport system substrate-binding protein